MSDEIASVFKTKPDTYSALGSPVYYLCPHACLISLLSRQGSTGLQDRLWIQIVWTESQHLPFNSCVALGIARVACRRKWGWSHRGHKAVRSLRAGLACSHAPVQTRKAGCLLAAACSLDIRSYFCPWGLARQPHGFPPPPVCLQPGELLCLPPAVPLRMCLPSDLLTSSPCFKNRPLSQETASAVPPPLQTPATCAAPVAGRHRPWTSCSRGLAVYPVSGVLSPSFKYN